MQTEQLSAIKLRGAIQMALLDPQGRILLERKFENLAVTVGRAWILGQLETVNQATAQTISYLAIGSLTTAPSTADPAVGGHLGER